MTEHQTTLREHLRALPRGAWILFFGAFLNKFGTFVLPFLAVYMQRLGYTAAQAGLAVGAYGLGNLGAAVLGGHLADRFGRRNTIILSMFSVAGAMLCLSQTRSLPMILQWSALAGLTGELYRPASSALLADLAPSGQRVTAFAAYRIAFNAGWVFGPVTASLLAKHSFLWLFLGDAATSVLFGVLAWFALPSGARGAPAHSAWRETLRVLGSDKRLQQVLVAWLLSGLVFMQIFSTMSLEITGSGFSTEVYGLVVSFNGALVVLFELPLTVLTRRHPPRCVMALGYLLIGVGFASNALPRTMSLLFLTMTVLTFGEMICMPVAAAYVAELAPPHQRGLYMGTLGLVGGLTFLCGPSLGLLLFSVSPLALWVLCGVLGLVAAAITLPERLPGRAPGTGGPPPAGRAFFPLSLKSGPPAPAAEGERAAEG
jgi:MFS family permease